MCNQDVYICPLLVPLLPAGMLLSAVYSVRSQSQVAIPISTCPLKRTSVHYLRPSNSQPVLEPLLVIRDCVPTAARPA